jgi:uncharacterized protein (DUF2147 family)
MTNIKLSLTILLTLIIASVNAQSVFGKWKTIDDETKKAKSIVEIYEKDGKLYGKITELFREPGEDPDPICEECDEDDDRHNQKVIGMEIIREMEKDDDEWEDGTILDPEDGKVYNCKLWVDEDAPNILNVRGYIAFFYRTQVWLRVE